MTDKTEKEKRKQLLHDLRKEAEQAFEKNLPMSRDRFNSLFDYLDIELSQRDCDDTNSLTVKFIEQHSISNGEEVLKWLADKGGYCDCEILANVEEQFEQ